MGSLLVNVKSISDTLFYMCSSIIRIILTLVIFLFVMTIVKRGFVARRRRKKILSLTKGALGSNSNLFRIAQQHSIKVLVSRYRGRRERKRYFRLIWIVRLNARVRMYGVTYNLFIYNLRKQKCLLNRKILSQLFFFDPLIFQKFLS
jgi:large subunit ribosomal protein L20